VMWKDRLEEMLPSSALERLRSIKDRLWPPDNVITYAPGGSKPVLPNSEESPYVPDLVEKQRCEQFIQHLRRAQQDARQAYENENAYSAFCEVLLLAVRNEPRLCLLDYGGNLGYYFQVATTL